MTTLPAGPSARRPGDRVHVPDLECHAVVTAVLLDGDGLQYRIGYFHNGDRKTCYLLAAEVEDPRK